MSDNKQYRAWSFTLHDGGTPFPAGYEISIIATLKQYGIKKYGFQEEKGAGGAGHFQAACSFGQGKRLSELGKITFAGDRKAHWSKTASEDDAFAYATKEDTRVRGPWKHTDVSTYVPVLYRGAVLKPVQQWIWNRLSGQDNRKVLFIIDRKGNTGKTFLGMWIAIHHKGVRLPVSLKGAQEMIQALMATIGTTPAESRYVVMDMPRSVTGRETWIKMLGTCEDTKNGHLCDPRYHWKEVFIEPPKMLVTCNHVPPMDLLTKDRFDVVDMLWIRFSCGELSQDEYREEKAAQKAADEERKEKRRARETADKKTESEEEEDEEDEVSVSE